MDSLWATLMIAVSFNLSVKTLNTCPSSSHDRSGFTVE